MELNKLTKIVAKSNRRIGRGHGSGRMKTSGRGTKGQKARGRIRPIFEGGQLPLSKRLPFLRGKTRNRTVSVKPVILNVSDLEIFDKDAVIDLNFLLKSKLINDSAIEKGVKILGNGTLTKSLIVKVKCSKQAQEKIEKAGGRLEK